MRCKLPDRCHVVFISPNAANTTPSIGNARPARPWARTRGVGATSRTSATAPRPHRRPVARRCHCRSCGPRGPAPLHPRLPVTHVGGSTCQMCTAAWCFAIPRFHCAGRELVLGGPPCKRFAFSNSKIPCAPRDTKANQQMRHHHGDEAVVFQARSFKPSPPTPRRPQ